MSAVGVRSLSILVVLVAGCAGADNQDLFTDNASPQNDTSSINPAPPSASAKTPSAPAPVAPPTSDPVPAPAPTQPVEPPAKCTQEVEPNNDLAHPNPFTTGFCGKIDTATDVDFGSFVVPKTATTITINHTEKGGALTYRYFLNGAPVVGNDVALRAIPGATYVVQVKAAPGGGGNRPTYELDVSFK